MEPSKILFDVLNKHKPYEIRNDGIRWYIIRLNGYVFTIEVKPKENVPGEWEIISYNSDLDY